MQFGVNMHADQSLRITQADTNLFGNLTFSNRYTGFPYADFLLGLPTTARRSFPAAAAESSATSVRFLFHGRFQSEPAADAELSGCATSITPDGKRTNGYVSTFDIKSGSIVVQDGSSEKVSPPFPKNYVNVVEASALGLPSKTLLLPTGTILRRAWDWLTGHGATRRLFAPGSASILMLCLSNKLWRASHSS